ncbi:PREDICTED: uncharacterized protein LOC105952539 [Erythranthe guttata]|uniref:uncharacterized protein LOC105952539 n=1 Tax=Erythranthe guttata TaxID=4155 RepID=UPI00064E0A44|nr:PREDICTED: uncharacterized protein LOC105952539 [Erythranthe guttata]|eukprot:XP_012831557.1 PREDICTED: uncharacterized protein LOC105952539 [Erythranthe guttata]
MANRTARAQIEDVSSSYFLHPSDGPGLVLVSQAPSEDNFASWSRAMVLSLTVKNKLGFMDGSIVEPPEDDPVLHNAWVCNNGMVMSWILNAISKDIQASVMQEQFSVNVYFTKMKAIWDELVNFRPNCTCGLLVDYYNQEQVMAFLIGLNESFSQTRGQILLMDPLPHINKVFALVSQEERQRSVGQSIEGHNYLTFVVRGAPVSQIFRPSAPVPHQNNSIIMLVIKSRAEIFALTVISMVTQWTSATRVMVFHLDINPLVSSLDQDWLLLQGEASSSREHSAMTSAQCQQILAYVSQRMAQQSSSVPSSVVPPQDDSHISCVTGTIYANTIMNPMVMPFHWVVDSGASKHICNNRSLFLHLIPAHNTKVILPDKSCLHVAFVGDVQLAPSLSLHNVFYVPEFQFNLLSVSALLSKPHEFITFGFQSFVIQDKLMQMIGMGKRLQGLYVLEPVLSAPYSSTQISCNKVSVSSQTWHNRLGHLPFSKLAILKDCISLPTVLNSTCCHVCSLAKFKRLPFLVSSSQSIAPVDLYIVIYGDLIKWLLMMFHLDSDESVLPSFDHSSTSVSYESYPPTTVPSSLPVSVSSPPLVRKSSRHIKIIAYLSDFQVNSKLPSTSKYPVYNVLGYSNISDSFFAYTSNISADTEPSSYKHAIQNPS